MPKGKAHRPEVKAAVMTMLLTGQGVARIAEEMGLPQRTVRAWSKGPEFAEVCHKKSERVESLIFEYLTTLLAELKAQVEIVSAREYLARQPAADVAVLHGVLADKAFRILSALPAQEAQTGTPA